MPRAASITAATGLSLMLASLLPVPAFAHHSAAATYDASHTVVVRGRVAEFAWRIPHCFLTINAESGDYKGRRYVVEMSSAVVLRATGWSASTFRVGDTVEITVMPSLAPNAAHGLCRECPVRVNGRVLTP